MNIKRLDHVNILTTELDRLIAFYEDILGLRNGDRPPFGFRGAWLYAGDAAYVHLVEVQTAPKSIEPQIEHFSFSATGFEAFKTRLETQKIEFSVDPVPGMPIVQVNLRDPDGNHIHVDFDSAETV